MPNRPLPTTMPARLGVFTSAEACARGWTSDALRHATDSGRIVRLRRGVFVAADRDDDELHPADRERRARARASVAAALVTTGSTVTGLSAATVAGWPVWAPRERGCLTVTGSRTTAVEGVHLHRGGIRTESVADLAGYRITRPARTVVDVAREFGTEAGLVVADAAVRAGATTPARVAAEVDRLCGRRGVGRARPLSALVDARAESVLESRSRWQLVAYELPPAQTQVWLYDALGRFLGRADLYWQSGVVGEVDGAGKLAQHQDRRAFLERQLGMTRAGLRIVRWGAADLHDFRATAAWIREELAAAAADPRPRRWVASSRRLGVQSGLWTPSSTDSTPSRG